MQASENGVLTFGGILFRPFLTGRFFASVIAPFLNDADFTRGGHLFYRVATDSYTLERAANLSARIFGAVQFEAYSVVIVTWFQVAEQGGELVYHHAFLSSPSLLLSPPLFLSLLPTPPFSLPPPSPLSLLPLSSEGMKCICALFLCQFSNDTSLTRPHNKM